MWNYHINKVYCLQFYHEIVTNQSQLFNLKKLCSLKFVVRFPVVKNCSFCLYLKQLSETGPRIDIKLDKFQKHWSLANICSTNVISFAWNLFNRRRCNQMGGIDWHEVLRFAAELTLKRKRRKEAWDSEKLQF